MKDFIQLQENSLDEIITNAMVLFQHNDLGAKIETSLNKETKKDAEPASAHAPLQLRLRLHNRFNMDLNNVYAMEIFSDASGLVVESSVNVYHDDFKQDDFNAMIMDVFNDVLKDVDLPFVRRRLDFNFRNAILHWKAAKEKQFIKDPEVEQLQQNHDRYALFHESLVEQFKQLPGKKIAEYLTFHPEVLLLNRKLEYAKSRILKIRHAIGAEQTRRLQEAPQFFTALLLEYCLVPLFLANELYVMSLIYKRNLPEIRTILRKRVQEV